MFTWLSENLATILICAALAAAVGLILRSMIRRRKESKSSCGSSCCGCPMGDSCHPEK